VGQSHLPLASGAEHVKAFQRAGWTCAKKRAKDAHFILHKPGEPHALSIPAHRQVKRALLQKQVRRAGLSDEEYVELFMG
jgi:predicted RNA binding protein YcfA (HicA-like mRNA interferase family)